MNTTKNFADLAVSNLMLKCNDLATNNRFPTELSILS